MIRTATLVLAIAMTIVSCKEAASGPLPKLGRTTTNADGQEIPHTIRPWTFTSQDSTTITSKDLRGEPYLADFFFTSCPSICPKVTKQMLRLYDHYDGRIKLISFTMDPKRDTPARLKQYATNLEVTSPAWLFLTGDKEFTLDLADDYFVAAFEDPDAPGGFDHSGKIILVDGDGHVRSFAEGTDPEDVTDLFADIDQLLADYENK
jgi:protein SCO1/2